MTFTNDAEVLQFLDRYDKQTKALKKEALKLCWFMRGGLTYDEAMGLSSVEKELISDIVKDNMETTKKSGLPFF